MDPPGRAPHRVTTRTSTVATPAAGTAPPIGPSAGRPGNSRTAMPPRRPTHRRSRCRSLRAKPVKRTERLPSLGGGSATKAICAGTQEAAAAPRPEGRRRTSLPGSGIGTPTTVKRWQVVVCCGSADTATNASMGAPCTSTGLVSSSSDLPSSWAFKAAAGSSEAAAGASEAALTSAGSPTLGALPALEGAPALGALQAATVPAAFPEGAPVGGPGSWVKVSMASLSGRQRLASSI
mmetsp:Transcript_15262/g.33521  ORF Transcript_15262/g.33521 Transcript_15262/m.33521 type:complete len:236 (-) Transcript_15262:108-815(-)